MSRFTNVCLNLTDNCNMRCTYCFVQQKPHYMDLQVAKDAVDYLHGNLVTSGKNKGSITYFGGEPTLCWDSVIVPLTQYIEETYPNEFSLNMTTNGSLLTAERLAYLKEHNIPILLSCDGGQGVQDVNRPLRNGENSFEVMEKVIPMVLETFPNTTFRGTVSQATCDKLFDSYIYAASKGFKYCFFCPNCREAWSEDRVELLRQEIHKIFAYMALCFSSGEYPLTCGPIKKVFQTILRHDLEVHYNRPMNIELERSPVRCGLGTGSASISFDGKIFGCQEQDSRDTNDYFYIGNIYDGIDQEKHKKLLEDYTKASKIVSEKSGNCDTCFMRRTCVADVCPSSAHDVFGNFFTRAYIDCEWHKTIAQDAITLMDMMVQQNNQTFKTWIDNVLKEGK